MPAGELDVVYSGTSGLAAAGNFVKYALEFEPETSPFKQTKNRITPT